MTVLFRVGVRAAVTAAMLGLVCQQAAVAVDLLSNVFESGSLQPFDSAGNGWKIWSETGSSLAEIGTTGRTFQTGTAGNDEALFITPYNDVGESTSDREGIVWTTDTPIDLTFDDGQVLYAAFESFSDTATFSDQYFKVDLRFGTAGDGGGYAGFDSSRDFEHSVNSNFNTEPSNSNRQARVGGGNGGNAEFEDIKYSGDDVQIGESDENTFLDRTYLMSTVWRPTGGDGGTPTGFNAEIMSEDGVNPIRYGEGTDGEGDDDSTPLKELPYKHLQLDRLTVHLRRHVGFYNGDPFDLASELLNGYNGHTGQATDVPFEESRMGIKSLRIGVTDVTDVNLDGVTDAADLAVIEGNQGLTGATLFQGDLNNDRMVDAADLDLFPSLVVPGDTNGDGSVNFGDLAGFSQALTDPAGYQAANPDLFPGACDINGDGNCNFGDLGGFSALLTGGAAAGSAAVPEPTTWALFAFAVLGLSGLRRRKVA